MTNGNIDVLIRGEEVVDGTGNPWFYGDIALGRDRVLEITPPGRLPVEAAGEVVEAAGGDLPRLYRYPQPFASAADARSTGAFQDHAGSDDGDYYGGGVDAGAGGGTYR